jgi:hypothetical protein
MAAPLNDDISGSPIPVDATVPAFNQDSFFFQAINENLWNSYQPYQLVILLDKGGEDYAITPFTFTLPIPPQELSISMPVADTIAATLTGYNEVHGGAPFRNITAAGTMGVIPEAVTGSGRSTVATGTQGVSQLVGAIGSQISQVQNSFGTLTTGRPPRVTNEYPGSGEATALRGIDSVPVFSTGYYFFHQLRQFLEGYLALKGRGQALSQGQDDDNKPSATYKGISLEPSKLRLAFCVWKDSAVYLVKLNNFEMRRTSESPLEYMYNLQMQAFKRINLKARGQSSSGTYTKIPKKSVISDVLNRVDAARKVIAGVGNVVNLGVIGTLATISELGRQVSGAVKDVAGIARNIIDLPATIANSILGDILDVYQSTMAGAAGVQQSINQFGSASNPLNQAIENKLSALGFARNGPKISGNPVGQLTQAETANITQGSHGPAAAISIHGQGPSGTINGTGSSFLDTGTSGNPPLNNTGIDPQDLLTDIPEIGDVNITTLKLSSDQQAQVDAEKANSAAMTVSDFATIRDSIRQNADNYMASIGSWDATYNDTYGIAAPSVAQRAPTRIEQDVLFSVAVIIQALDNFIVVLRDQGGQQTQPPNGIEYMAQLAQQSGIDFRVPKSKYAIPTPYGYTLERIAQRYLGDANRWLEIAALNGLRAPYIDEDGFNVPLIVNGNGATITLANADNLFLGQKISIASNIIKQETRTIISIEPNDLNSVTVSLNGDADLDKLKLVDQAYVHAYLPATINSKQALYLPNGSIPTVDPGLDGIPNIDITDPFINLGGVDWLLTTGRDLVVTPYGDNPLAYGLTSVIQGAQVAFSTDKGSLEQHPEWGFGPLVGASQADVNINQLLQDMQQFFSGDPLVSGLQSATIQKTGDSLFINANIGVKGFDRGIPVLLTLGPTR